MSPQSWVQLNVRVTPEEYAEIQEARKLAGGSMRQLIVRRVLGDPEALREAAKHAERAERRSA
jgi:uncharacterized protein (DUF1778 family)